MRFEARHLELLLAVERAGSISSAARLLGTDQPQVTRLLRRIEQELGHAVFERAANGTTATAAGTQTLNRAREAMAALNYVRDAEPAEPSTLQLLCYGLDMTHLLTRLRVSRPGLSVTVAWREPAAAYAEVLSGAADVFAGVRLPHAMWPGPGAGVETEIAADPTVVYLAAGHRLAGKAELDLRDLAEEDWITGEDPHTWRMVRQECRLLGGFEPRLSYQTDDSGVIVRLLSEGLGIVFGGYSSSRRDEFVARPYRGSTPAVRTMLHRAGHLPASLVDDITALVREDRDIRHAQARAADAADPVLAG